MEFEKRKKATLATMSSPEPDKSPKGDIDAPIIPLLKTLNTHPSYFTTSSCSGRISILSTPTATTTVKKKAKGGNWVFITHEFADPNSVQNLIFPLNPNFDSTQPSNQENLVFRCSIRLEVPLGDTHMIMVSKEYLNYLVGIANEKMEANRKRTDSFHDALLKIGFLQPEIDSGIGDYEFLNMNQDLGYQDSSLINGGEDGIQPTGEIKDDTSSGVLELSLPIKPLVITGEPVEKLHLWGHSACTLETTKNPKSVLLFGGFGGMGRHARRNDSWLLDSVSGQLELVDFANSPPPRLGHTASLVGDLMFVIGGRADPGNVLNDVWVLSITNNEWKQFQCDGIDFPLSHRHAAAFVGSDLYVFGGIHNGIISSVMYRLDTHNMKWEEVIVHGQKPSARHSHTLVAYGSELFMFGGFDGVKALGDLYSFDVHSCIWKKEKMTGTTPYARFSHTMFVYKNYIGVMGGCPIKQHYQEISIFEVGSGLWKRIKLNSIGEDLFVRSTTSVVGDDLVIVGGGASCYAFGTKFSEPMRINLLPLLSLAEIRDVTNDETDSRIQKRSNGGFDMNLEGIYGRQKIIPLRWVLRVDKKHAKPAKDVLKKFGWLDTERKVYTQENGVYVCFPITKEFMVLYQNKKSGLNEEVDEVNDLNFQEILKISSSTKALYLLVASGAMVHADHVVKIRKASSSPLKVMKEAVASLLNRHNLPSDLLEQLPARWERLGDIVVLPMTSFKDSIWDSLGNELWSTVAESLGARRLARQGRISATGTRDSGLEILVGDDGWVDHRENGVLYSFDATKCMFSWGNLSEKRRMGELDCKDEVIVDLFAGIGYFTLPFLVKANAKMVYACEWNPHAIEALRRNLEANSVADRCVVLEGDNRVMAPKGVADRVNLGLLPSSEGSWEIAVRALRSNGGMMHVHGNVKDKEEESWTKQVSKSIKEISRSEGYDWDVSIEHVERVKWYAPHIRHLVVDIRCKQIES
ncbi:tRNA wybutosine-synthesizing protein 2/3/4 isoform X2 [Cynara cardunculus var. scolymus]|uniref:tRNA wybutosine-synthesizing protein 2/3/4 isoform X2 n=1 Tax=Cynara cardunculus var. scolymus TaxID=59895 RepID=UPI000D62A05C|nr:tRNA wybutosine-synthesizing protein 2/3/4 isoform X2 [Cynara cardunculus var. scolymus]